MNNFSSRSAVKFCLVIFTLALSSAPLFISAQETENRSYHYDSVDVTYTINQESTVDVEEQQTYVYSGNFHSGLRSISTKGSDQISNIEVIDGETNLPLEFSSEQLDKLNPSSWGKYTVFKESGFKNIEWYYNLENTTHEWIIKYRLHGAIEFNKTGDRFYWNIFTDYDVPVNNSQVNVVLPGPASTEEIAQYSYRNQDIKTTGFYDENKNTFTFQGQNFIPREAFTIDVGWPKDIVSHAAYWQDFFRIYYGILGAVFFVILSFVTGLIFWFREEKFKYGRRSIVPEYEPPQKLKPAMAEIITKEKLTPKGLSATAVDLAVRGYIKITEDKKSWTDKLPIGILSLFFFIPLVFLLINSFAGRSNPASIAPFMMGVFVLIFIILRFVKKSQNFTLTLQKSLSDKSSDLEEYEKKYLDILFASGDTFSTREQSKKTNAEKIIFTSEMRKLEKEILKETETDTNAYIVGPLKERKRFTITVFLIFGIYFVGAILSGIFSDADLSVQPVLLTSGFLIAFVGLVSFIKYEARLSKEGKLLKDEWLGFKMYLEIAEKHRLQNLTPDLFEKYLPYAMIFGVEKKWAKAFESMHLENPSWYNTSAAVTGAGISTSSFSPSAFSSSFSSSFTSSFSSSGATGSTGGAGGGSAGGGGGGGGGGAG